MSDIHPAPLRDTYWVLPGPLLAGAHPGNGGKEALQTRVRALVNAGMRTFVDLTDEDEKDGIAGPVPGYRGVLRRLAEDESIQTTYTNIPIIDRCVPSPWTLRCILDVIDRSVSDENPVYVHCWAGRGRTGTIIGCYLKRHGLALDQDVIQKLAELRKQVSNRKDSSPHTKEQVRMVTTWKRGA